MDSLKFYFWQLLIAVDQLFNAIFGGWADETMSSRLYRLDTDGRFWGILLRPVVDFIFYFEPNHCYQAFLSERDGTQEPPELRTKK